MGKKGEKKNVNKLKSHQINDFLIKFQCFFFTCVFSYFNLISSHK